MTGQILHGFAGFSVPDRRVGPSIGVPDFAPGWLQRVRDALGMGLAWAPGWAPGALLGSALWVVLDPARTTAGPRKAE